MPRPRTKGAPIQVRLELPTDEWLREAATWRSLPPSAYAAHLLERIRVAYPDPEQAP